MSPTPSSHHLAQGCSAGAWALGALGLTRVLRATLLVRSLASPGAKANSGRYLPLGTAPVRDAHLMTNGPVSSFGTLCLAKRRGRQLLVHRP